MHAEGRAWLPVEQFHEARELVLEAYQQSSAEGCIYM